MKLKNKKQKKTKKQKNSREFTIKPLEKSRVMYDKTIH